MLYMKILMTGATGFVGTPLVHKLHKEGHELVIVSRNSEKIRARFSFPVEIVKWDLLKGPLKSAIFKDLDAVVHLAGESIVAGRWTSKRKKILCDSRVIATENLVKSIKLASGTKPLTMVSTSAIGFYGNRGEELLTEYSSAGDDFLAHLCIEWEREARQVADLNARLIQLRLGVILGPGGGALAQMMPAFSFYCGAQLGNGQQWMSWVHLDDVISAFCFAIDNQKIEGIFNVTAPYPVRNVDFTKLLSQAMGKKAFLPIPSVLLKIVLGEMAVTVLGSIKVSSEKLSSSGFHFQHPQLEEALTHILSQRNH